jgi:hypothetical protein
MSIFNYILAGARPIVVVTYGPLLPSNLTRDNGISNLEMTDSSPVLDYEKAFDKVIRNKL